MHRNFRFLPLPAPAATRTFATHTFGIGAFAVGALMIGTFWGHIAHAAEANYPIALTQEDVKKLLTAPSPQTVVATYAHIGFAAYGDAYLGAVALRDAAKEFQKEPTQERLATMRETWLAARKPYLMTEAFRFYDGPIDVFTQDIEIPGPETRINPWPIRPDYLEATPANPNGGLTGRMKNIDQQTLRDANLLDDDRNVSSGYHVIEYLLWGEPAKGNPSHELKYFTDGTEYAKRRTQMLVAACEVLVQETMYLRADWYPLDKISYANRMMNTPNEGVGRILTGLATLSGYELPEKHLGLRANDGDKIVLQSPYSRSSYDDLLQTVTGMRQIMQGTYGPVKGPGIFTLLALKDPDLAAKLNAQSQAVIDAVKALPHPLEDALPAKPKSAAHAAATKAAEALVLQAKMLVKAGKVLGVTVDVTGD